jgi:hypothetical protein
VDVEDLLREALIGVDRRVEEDERERCPHQHDGGNGERGQWDVAQPEKHESAGMIAERAALERR